MRVVKRGARSVHGTQSIRRAIDVLRQVAIYDRSGIRLVDVAQQLALDKSTAYRILGCLESEKLLARKQPGQRYVLGPLAYEIGISASRRFPLATVARPHLQRMADQTGDAVFLSLRGGFEFVCIDKIEGTYPLKAYRLDVGVRRPLGLGAVGTAILSAIPAGEVSEVLAHNEAALAHYEDTAVADALGAVIKAKRKGYSLQDRPPLGLRAVAVPLRGAHGDPLGAISISALSSRLNSRRATEIARMLKHEARLIESKLGAA